MDIREIKEVRRGISSKDFERSPDYLRRLDPNCCLVIFYGMEFKLKTLSCVGKYKHPLKSHDKYCISCNHYGLEVFVCAKFVFISL